ncbi:multidrug resistance-associated protein 1-like [Planoprotostelium fungivorum]|uniref:Multidrug resistance-associated protein 1-like n=1 Tax=Planoprotostelium fungivorum TaxID=1890364 RepID=A0A2P6NW84_9EUKA|nr:multidrug resistance-associated protein 1-like [Planoprotostelium fungivorum]
MSPICGSSTMLPFHNGEISPCFQDIAVTGATTIMLVGFSVYRYMQLRGSHNAGVPFTVPQLVRLSSFVAASILTLLRGLAAVGRTPPYISYGVAGQVFGWSTVALVSQLEYSRGRRMSWIVKAYIIATYLNGGSQFFRDFLGLGWIGLIIGGLLLACAIVSVISILYLEELPKDYGVLNDAADVPETETAVSSEDHKKVSPEPYGNPFSRFTYWWVNPLMALGYSRTLELDDMFGLPKNYDPETITDIIRNSAEKRRGRSYLWTIWDVAGTDLVKAGILKGFHDIIVFGGPIILRYLIVFVTTRSTDITTGLMYVFLLLLTSLVDSITGHYYWYSIFTLGLKVNVTGSLCVYQKSMKLSSASRQTQTVGDITNLLTVDVKCTDTAITCVHAIWTAILQIVVAMFLLWNQLGPSSLAGAAVLALCTPINGYLAKFVAKYQKEIMQIKDERVKAMSEVLGGIRIIKFFAWEIPYIKNITSLRSQEIAKYRQSIFVRCFSDFFWVSSPTMVSVATFTFFTLLGNKLTAEIAFTSISLLNILRHPLTSLSGNVYSLIEAKVSIDRLNRFFRSEEIDPADIHREKCSDPNAAIQIDQAAWQWEKDGFVLGEISMKVPRGSLVAIVGPVGSGKTTLLSGILGEAPKSRGEVTVDGSVAYVAQQAWIRNATVRDNILMGSPCDPERYRRVLNVCELESDLKILTDGDKTEIGERGINVSGGQRQRVALARAVYQNKDIVLLDDCLSAVDAHVGKSIFDRCISGELKGKTRVFVTHQIQHLSGVDYVIVLGTTGQMAESGTYKELMKEPNGQFRKLIEEHVKKLRESTEVEKAVETIEIPDKKTLRESLNKSAAKLITTEERAVGRVSLGVWISYVKSCGGYHALVLLLFFYSLYMGMKLSSDFWMSYWSTRTPEEQNNVVWYLVIYSLFSFGTAFGALFSSFVLKLSCIKSSIVLHESMIKSVMGAPMAFFDTTPVGRIINRFSKDLYNVDSTLPMCLDGFLWCLFEFFGVVIVMVYTTPTLGLIILPLGWIYSYAQQYFIQSSREMQRLQSISKSPIISHLGESLQGLVSVRAFGKVVDFSEQNEKYLLLNARSFYSWVCGNRWLGVRLEFLGTMLVVSSALACVLSAQYISPGYVGLVITYALGSTMTLNWLVRTITDAEAQMVAVERIGEYSVLRQEEDKAETAYSPHREYRTSERKLTESSAEWPRHGGIHLKDVKFRYRDGLPLVLNGLTLKIAPHEKVGVVGRTGAGKSSLMLALFRIAELSEGSIEIDNVDTSRLSLRDLRSKLSIIPQDPVLFTGTVRSNLDPFEEYDDGRIWEILDSVRMADPIRALPGKLDATVSEGGENFSVGQRQLFCLGRALIKGARILILDEATAAVDFETDKLIQETIRRGFEGATVLTIAHRINTIMDYDKVLVLEKGRVAEYDAPEELLKNPQGIFTSLYHNTRGLNPPTDSEKRSFIILAVVILACAQNVRPTNDVDVPSYLRGAYKKIGLQRPNGGADGDYFKSCGKKAGPSGKQCLWFTQHTGDGHNGELGRPRTEVLLYDFTAKDGETWNYQWNFFIPSDFPTTADWCHIHQQIAQGGPAVTHTIHPSSFSVESKKLPQGGGSGQSYISIPKDKIFGRWISANETITYGKRYRLVLKAQNEVLANIDQKFFPGTSDEYQFKMGTYNDNGSFGTRSVAFTLPSIKKM